MIKTLIFKPFFTRVLFVLAGVFLVAMIATLAMNGSQKPDFAYFLIISFSIFMLGKRIQFTRR